MGADFSVAGPVLELVGGVPDPELQAEGPPPPRGARGDPLARGAERGLARRLDRVLVPVVRRPRALAAAAGADRRPALARRPRPQGPGEALLGAAGVRRRSRGRPISSSWQARFRELLDELVAEGSDGAAERRAEHLDRPGEDPGREVPRGRVRAGDLVSPEARPARAQLRLPGGARGRSGRARLRRLQAARVHRPHRRRARRPQRDRARLQDVEGGPGPQADRRSGQAPAPALHARGSRPAQPRPDRRPLPPARRLRQAPRPRLRAEGRDRRGRACSSRRAWTPERTR